MIFIILCAVTSGIIFAFFINRSQRKFVEEVKKDLWDYAKNLPEEVERDKRRLEKDKQ